jgi:CPA1 family monovalent cation:H+ antiporter
MTALVQFDAIFNIIFILTVISLTARIFHIPSVSALIFAGIIASFASGVPLPILNPEMFTLLLLPPILFGETLHTDVDSIIDDSGIILSYAVVGTLLMLTAVALFSYFILGFTIIEAVLLGIIISPTDPVAVIYAFHQMGVIKRFQLLVSGESLFNDGVSIAMYLILVSIITIGSLTILDVVKIGSIAVIGGIIIGMLGGYVAHTLFCMTDDKFANVLVSFIIAFGVFRLSESFHASGVIATVVAGLIINYRTRYFGGIGKESFEMLETLWEFVGFAASSFAFIYIGMNFEPTFFLYSLRPIIVFFILLIFFRYVTVQFVGELFQRLTGKPIPGSWRFGLFWSGLRGAVSIVLVLGLHGLALPNSDTMIALTFGVVIISNLLHGPTIPRVIRWLDLSASGEAVRDLHEDLESMEWMDERYITGTFNTRRSLFQKIFFSAPEFLVLETSFGRKLFILLQRVRNGIRRQLGRSQ